MSLVIVIVLGLGVLWAVGGWTTFKKAGRPGWAALVPILNTYVAVKLAGRSGWWLLLLLLPYIGLVFQIIVNVDLARKFNKGTGFGLGLAFLPFIYYPILGLGRATYGTYDQYTMLNDVFA